MGLEGNEVVELQARFLSLARVRHAYAHQIFSTEGTEPSPQKTRSGQGIWLRVLGLDLCALGEKRIF